MEPKVLMEGFVVRAFDDGKMVFWKRGDSRSTRPCWSPKFSTACIYPREGNAKKLVEGNGSHYFTNKPGTTILKIQIVTEPLPLVLAMGD